jgi:hypothetical protein
VEREGKIEWRQCETNGEIIKKQQDHKRDLKDLWQEIQTSEDWKKLEEFSFVFISHLSDEMKVTYFSNLKDSGNETDSIICLKDSQWGDVLVEAKNRRKPEPRDIDQIRGRLQDKKIYLGFLVSKYRLTGKNGQISAIRSINKDGKNLIVPLQGFHIDGFFASDESTKDFLFKMIKISKYNPMKLAIPKKQEKKDQRASKNL